MMVRYHGTPSREAEQHICKRWEGVEPRALSTAQPLGKTVWRCLAKLNGLFPYNPAAMFPGLYPEQLKIGARKTLNTDVCRSFTQSCQNLGNNKMSFNK